MTLASGAAKTSARLPVTFVSRRSRILLPPTEPRVKLKAAGCTRRTRHRESFSIAAPPASGPGNPRSFSTRLPLRCHTHGLPKRIRKLPGISGMPQSQRISPQPAWNESLAAVPVGKKGTGVKPRKCQCRSIRLAPGLFQRGERRRAGFGCFAQDDRVVFFAGDPVEGWGGTQGLKPASFWGFPAPLKPCPFTFRAVIGRGRTYARLELHRLSFCSAAVATDSPPPWIPGRLTPVWLRGVHSTPRGMSSSSAGQSCRRAPLRMTELKPARLDCFCAKCFCLDIRKCRSFDCAAARLRSG